MRLHVVCSEHFELNRAIGEQEARRDALEASCLPIPDVYGICPYDRPRRRDPWGNIEIEVKHLSRVKLDLERVWKVIIPICDRRR